MIKILHRGQQGSARSCSLPKLRKIKFSGIFCSELGLGVFTNFVDMGVSFQLLLVGLHLDFYNFTYD